MSCTFVIPDSGFRFRSHGFRGRFGYKIKVKLISLNWYFVTWLLFFKVMQWRGVGGGGGAEVMLNVRIRNDDFYRNTALKFWNNVATIRKAETLRRAKNRRCGSFRVGLTEGARTTTRTTTLWRKPLFDNFIISVPIVMSWEASVLDDVTRRTGNRNKNLWVFLLFVWGILTRNRLTALAMTLKWMNTSILHPGSIITDIGGTRHSVPCWR